MIWWDWALASLFFFVPAGLAVWAVVSVSGGDQ